ncbi:hypothetical protein J3R30DRAFT_3713141 [Lentinula aciculospora]|uniref:DUF6534 domain-containing protein n=1 Tax=Lentinula aciculospora TaxID=153920 RepID=A0A9W9DGS7_9AGAR|nr:hypothetical protein J3R30DRAFT_3713141 [Lentinula aciculospora]
MAPSSITSVFGSGLVGIVLAATLFGIYSSQVYSYYNNYSKDRAWMKLLVAVIWVVLSLQYSLNLHAIYTYLIDDFGQDAKLAVADWDWLSYVLLTSITSILVQLFFARRLFYLLRNKFAQWIVPIVISIFSLIGFIFGVFMTQRTSVESQIRPLLTCYDELILHQIQDTHEVVFQLYTSNRDGVSIFGLGRMWFAISALLYACVTRYTQVGLALRGTQIESGLSSVLNLFRSTDRLINKLMIYSIQTGAVTSFTEIFCLATYTASGFHFGHILVVFPLSGLYATSFLANLHSRHPNTPSPSPPTGSDMQFIEMSVNKSHGSSQATKAEITVNRNGRSLRMSVDGPIDIETTLDYTLSDSEYFVKAPHNEYDAGTVV